MIGKEEEDYFLSNLDNYQPMNMDLDRQRENNHRLYGIFETDEERKKEEYKKMQFSKEYRSCKCKKESLFNIDEAVEKIRLSRESIYVCTSTKKYRIYHTTSN